MTRIPPYPQTAIPTSIMWRLTHVLGCNGYFIFPCDCPLSARHKSKYVNALHTSKGLPNLFLNLY